MNPIRAANQPSESCTRHQRCHYLDECAAGGLAHHLPAWLLVGDPSRPQLGQLDIVSHQAHLQGQGRGQGQRGGSRLRTKIAGRCWFQLVTRCCMPSPSLLLLRLAPPVPGRGLGFDSNSSHTRLAHSQVDVFLCLVADECVGLCPAREGHCRQARAGQGGQGRAAANKPGWQQQAKNGNSLRCTMLSAS